MYASPAANAKRGRDERNTYAHAFTTSQTRPHDVGYRGRDRDRHLHERRLHRRREVEEAPHHHKPAKSSLAGKWSGSYSGAFSGTFTLKWKQSGSKLTGSIRLSKPHGTHSCTGRVHDGHITFGAVSAGATYKGSVSGSSMSGTYKTPKGGGSWSAHKIS